jgi:hypothetical protein
LMRHEHATHAPVELLEIRKTATSPDLVLQYTPEAFNGIEMVTAPRDGKNCNRKRPCQWASVEASVCARWMPLRSTTITTSFPAGAKMTIT